MWSFAETQIKVFRFFSSASPKVHFHLSGRDAVYTRMLPHLNQSPGKPTVPVSLRSQSAPFIFPWGSASQQHGHLLPEIVPEVLQIYSQALHGRFLPSLEWWRFSPGCFPMAVLQICFHEDLTKFRSDLPPLLLFLRGFLLPVRWSWDASRWWPSSLKCSSGSVYPSRAFFLLLSAPFYWANLTILCDFDSHP